jgi:predicted extracellular nuclease
MRIVAPLLLAAAVSLTMPSAHALRLAVAQPERAIGAVQGSGERSPFEGQVVTIRGKVTADLRRGLGGVFLQDGGDGDPATSDGIFVPLGNDVVLPSDPWLQVTGNVEERAVGKGAQLLTTLATPFVVMVQAPDSMSAIPVVQELAAPPADWETLEGMQVRITAPLMVGALHQLARHGELGVSFDGRIWQPSEVAEAGSEAYAVVVADNRRRMLWLDDGSNARDVGRPAYLPQHVSLRSGMQLGAVEGIVDPHPAGGFRLQLTTPLQVPALERPAAPQVAGRFKVAAFNLENFFNGDGQGAGFPTARGAATPELMRLQLDKLLAAITGLDPDVAALMELENDGYGPQSSIAQLVDALNSADPHATDWRFVDAGQGPGDNTIRLGIIYRASRLTALGKPAVLELEPFGERSRVPLAQAFKPRKGKPFVVVANHFKSKGCSEAQGADANQNDGQGCWNATRVASARLLHEWMSGDPTGTGAKGVILLGDFNAYAKESPMLQLHSDGWRDAFEVAGVERPYSYVYDGMSGRLDHALLNGAMAKRLRGAAEWHINADEPADAGYRGRNVPGPWRSSDHDPLLLGFDR